MNIALPFFPKPYHRMGQYVKKPEGAVAPSITIKQPEVVDVSFYNGAIDWSKVSPLPFGVIVKATEWTSTDSQFTANWQALGALKVPRACYHFYHNGQLFYNSARQASAFVAAIKKAGGFTENDYFIIDDEETDSKGNSLLSAGEMIDFLYNVQLGLGLKDTSHLLIYSTANLLNNLSFAKLTAGQPQWLKQIRVWTAGYPNSPDNFSNPPASYIPDPVRWGKVIMWQYSDSVPPFGDVNWIDPVFENEWAGQTQPAPTPQPQPSPTIQDIEINVLSSADVSLASVNVDGTDYTTISHITVSNPAPPPPAPVPTPLPTSKANRYQILFDFTMPASYYNGKSRTAAPNWTGNPITPATCRINGIKTSYNLTQDEINAVTKINAPYPTALKYISAHQGGWVNYGYWPNVECLTFEGNIVDVLQIDASKNRAYIRVWNGEDGSGVDDDCVIHHWTNIGSKNQIYTGSWKGPAFIILAYEKGAWIELDKLVKI